MLANRIYIGEIFHKENAYPGEQEAIIDRDLWESVRAKLAENHRARKNRINASEPSLLSGRIFDQDGCLYTPSHAVKNGKRYRYYVSRNIIRGRTVSLGQPTRIPAREVEQLVLSELRKFFESIERVAATLGTADHGLETTRALLEGGQQFVKRLAVEPTSLLREMLACIALRVTIRTPSRLTLQEIAPVHDFSIKQASPAQSQMRSRSR